MEAVEKSALFVCLGNICRSPMAEGIFQKIVKENGSMDQWMIDSAATADYHTGGRPDNRTLKILRRHGIADYNHTVRQINRSDFDKFDFILVMDESNLEDVKEISPKSCKAVIKMLGSFDKNASLHRIPDPYYGQDIEDFEKVYQQCFKCCTGFFTWASAN